MGARNHIVKIDTAVLKDQIAVTARTAERFDMRRARPAAANTFAAGVIRRIFLCMASALAVSLSAFDASLAQSDSLLLTAPVRASGDNWTVLTMAPDGSWGVATDISTNRAIARAFGNCKTMSGPAIGCGAMSSTIRAGWSLGIRCGDRNIILVSEKTLADAEKAAINREIQLRQVYVSDMPPCMRIVTVDPRGAIVAPKLDYLSRVGRPTSDAVAQ